jgi:hypothetical protein
MRIFRLHYIGLITVFFLVISCRKEDDLIIRELPLSGFKHLTQGEGVQVHLYPSDTYSVEVETTASRIDKIIAEVQDSTLYVEAELPGFFAMDYRPVKVYVGTPQLNIIRNDGEQCIYSDQRLVFPKLILKSEDVYGHLNTGNMRLEVECEWVQVISNGISNIEVTGTTLILDLRYYNSIGRFEGRELEAQGVRIMHKGENTLTVNPRYYIRGDIYSYGDILAVHHPPYIEVREHHQGRLRFE